MAIHRPAEMTELGWLSGIANLRSGYVPGMFSE